MESLLSARVDKFMTSLTHSNFEPTGEETRLVVETLLEVVPGTQIVAVVTNLEETVPGFELEPMVSEGSQVATSGSGTACADSSEAIPPRAPSQCRPRRRMGGPCRAPRRRGR